jgi:hypothetical protein
VTLAERPFQICLGEAKGVDVPLRHVRLRCSKAI